MNCTGVCAYRSRREGMGECVTGVEQRVRYQCSHAIGPCTERDLLLIGTAGLQHGCRGRVNGSISSTCRLADLLVVQNRRVHLVPTGA